MKEPTFKYESPEQHEPKSVHEYPPATDFQKKAFSIDREASHQWGAVGDHYEVADDFGTVMVGRCAKGPDGPDGILIAEKANDGECSSFFIDNLDAAQTDEVFDFIQRFGSHLHHEDRHAFIRKIVDDAHKLKPGDVVAEKLGIDMLDLLPDVQDEEAVEESVCSHPIMEEFRDPKQREQFEDFILVLARKLPEGLLEGKLDEMLGDMRSVHDQFGANYSALFADALNWAVKSRKDAQADRAELHRQSFDSSAVL